MFRFASVCLCAAIAAFGCGDSSDDSGAPEDASVRDATTDGGATDRDGALPPDGFAPAGDGGSDDGGTTVGGPLRAFPTAIGAAAEITGGRGGSVYHVTNLDDSGPGSLRDAVSESNRTIVFDVSGRIVLESRLTANADNITIAGQTAPGAGITVDGENFMIYNSDNWIVRYVRFRGGYAAADTPDSFAALNSIRVYVDHCSMSFGADEGASLTQSSGSTATTGEATMGRCLVAESKTGTILDGEAGYTSYQNLYYNISHRFPNVASPSSGSYDIINNVVWNYSNRLIRGNDEADIVHLGNYADIGTTPMRDDRINQYQYRGVEPRIFTEGNVIVAVNSQSPNTHGVEAMNADNRLMWSFFDGTLSPYVEDDRLPTEWFAATRRELLGVAPIVLSAEEAFAQVPRDVGANRSLGADGATTDNTDDYDEEWIANVLAGVYAGNLSIGEYSVDPLPSEERPADFDTDRDGMPDVWERANGFDPDTPDDSGDADEDGYTNLEEYLDLVDL